jgi:hypothetical protein
LIKEFPLNKKREIENPNHSSMRMGLLNQTREAGPTKSRENPKKEITHRSGITRKYVIKPIKVQKPIRI